MKINQQHKKEEGFFVVSFDMASPKRGKDRLTSADARHSRTVRRVNSRFVRALKFMGFRSQRSMFVVPNSYRQELQVIKENAERSLRRLGEPYSIFLLTCVGKSNRAILASVAPEVEKNVNALAKEITRRGDKVLTARLTAKAAKMIPLIQYFNRQLAETLSQLVVDHSKEAVRLRKLQKASEEINKHYDRASLFGSGDGSAAPSKVQGENTPKPPIKVREGYLESINEPVDYPLADLNKSLRRPSLQEPAIQPQLALHTSV